YLSIADDRDGDALRQHCWRPDLVRQHLGSGVPCFPPKFSFFISDPLNVAELGFFLLLAVIASKAVAVVTKDDRVTRRPKWRLIGWGWRQGRLPENFPH